MSTVHLLKLIGEDPAREGLKDTPSRVENFYRQFFTGYNKDAIGLLQNCFTAIEGYNEPIILKDLDLRSFCEHHLLPMYGKVHIAYIPNGRIVGIGKIAEVVDIFARRLQMQECLTQQIGQALTVGLNAKGVAVVCKLQHFCLSLRSSNAQNSKLKTSYYSGLYKDDLNLRTALKF